MEKYFNALLVCFLTLFAGAAIGANIDVSQPSYSTVNNAYDRNPSIMFDGGDYWLFYTKGDNVSTDGVRGPSYNPDADTYVVYYKTASTIDGLAGAAETKLALSETNRPADFDQRVVSAAAFDGKIYAFVSSGQSGTDRGLYYYEYGGGSWTGPLTLIADATARGGHVNIVSDNSYIYIVWESSDGSSDCYTWNGTTLSSKVDIDGGNQPKITYYEHNKAGNLFVVNIEDGTGDIEVFFALASPNPLFSPHSTAIPGGGFYDPCIFTDGIDLYVVSAPWVAVDRQYLIQTMFDVSTSTWSDSKVVSYGGYSDTEWWDYWPCGYHDGSNAYVFYTTETSSPAFSDGEIAYFKMDWDLANDHYFYIQNAVDQAGLGDTIAVAAGTYNVATQIFIDKALTLIGEDAATTIIDGPGSPVTIACAGLIAVDGLSGSISIKNFTLLDAPEQASTWDITLLVVKNMAAGADVTAENNIFIGRNDNTAYDHGIWIGEGDLSSHITIKNNDLSGMYLGVLLERMLGTSTVENNDIHNLIAGLYGPNAPLGIQYLTYDGDVTTQQLVRNNTLRDYAGYDIAFQGGHAYISDGKFTDVKIQDNTVNAIGSGPEDAHVGIILINDPASDFNACGVHNAEISGNSLSAGGIDSKGVKIIGHNTNITVLQNYITDLGTGILVEGTGFPDVTVNGNAIYGNTNFGIEAAGSFIVDAAGNWWGISTPAGVAGEVSDYVDYTPWLNTGDDTDPVSPGFQGDFSILWVDDSSPQTGAAGYIQEGIDLVSGSTVNVVAGTYYETLNITAAGLELIGESRATVIIDPTGLATNNAGIYVAADNVTLQSLTLQSTVTNSLPRYGIKFGDVDGCALEDVTVRDVYRSGIDALGTSNLTVSNVSSLDNGGHGLSLVDCNDVDVTDITLSGNGWQNVSVATWGLYTPLGTSGIVFDGTSSFGDLFQLEMGDYNNPGVPPAGEAVITYSTNPVDAADVTVLASDFGFALHGEQDDSPDQARIWFFSTLANAAIVPTMTPIGHWTGNAMYIESFTDRTQLYITPGCSIQAAIDAANSGYTINVAAGLYTENIDVNKYVEIVGAGSGNDLVSNTIIAQNPAGAGDTKIGIIQLSASGNSETSPILFRDIRVAPDGMAGFSVGRFTEATGVDISYIKLDNVIVVGNNVNPNTEQERGLYVDLTSSLRYLTITNSAFDSLTYGWYLQKEVSADASTVENVTVTGTSFNHNNHKGIYAEKLTDATFTDCTVSENGFTDLGMPSYFVPWMCGIDFNLKAGTYQNFTFNNCTVTDNALGGAKEGVGLTVKGRGTGNNPSGGYTAFPAWVNNVVITGGTFTGNERGMRFGEPGKENASPTNVTITDADIHSNVQTYSGFDGSAYGDVVNQMMAGVGVDAEENWWGTILYSVIDGNTPGEVDFVPWCLDATHTNCTLTYPITEVWVDDDWASSSQGDIVNGHVFGYNAFATIQDGIDNVIASTVNVMAGTYPEALDINKSLTLSGESEAGVIIDASSISDYGLYASGDYTVTLENFTLIGPSSPTYGYGVKISGEDAIVSISNVTVQNCGRSGFDLNGITSGNLQSLTATNNGGVGLALSDCDNVTVDNLQTSGNAWAGVGIFTYGQYYTGGSDNITFTGSNTIPDLLYTQIDNYNDLLNPYPITNLTIPFSLFAYTASNNLAPTYIAYLPDLTTAIAAVLGGPDPINSFIIERASGEFYVGNGMTIQAAIIAAGEGDLINVLTGTYPEVLNIATNNLSIIGAGRTEVTIDAGGLSGYNGSGIYVTGNAVTLQGLTFIGEPSAAVPRYGIKYGDVIGGALTDVLITEFYRTGIDMLGTDGLTLTNVESTNNGGNGIQTCDGRNISFNGITTNGNAWGGVGIFTWGRYTPLGVENIVFTGTNSFGETGTDNGGLYLEEGNYSDPANPEPITFSNDALDLADVTVLLSDFVYYMRGDSDNDNTYTRFYLSLSDILSALAGSPGHITTNRTMQSLMFPHNFYVYDIPNGLMTIQAGISASVSDDTINVAAGTYNEQVRFTKSLTVTGSGLVLIDPNGAEFDGPRSGVDKVRAAVTFENSCSGSILENVTIENSNSSDLNGNAGIELIAGEIDNVIVRNVIVNGVAGHGFGSYHPDHTWPPSSGWLIDNCSFSTTDTDTWSGMRPENMDNLTIQDCDIGPTNYGGILLIQANGAVVQRCEVNNTQRAGIQIDAYCTGTIDILDNEVWNANLSGASGYSDIRLYSTQENPHGNTPATITISENTLRDGVNGIYVKPGDLSTRTSVIVEENKIVNHSSYGVLNDATGILNAEQNWWGAYCGPYHLTANPDGQGDEVSDNVDFDPWCNEDFTVCTFSASDPAPAEVWVDDDYANSLANDGYLWCIDAFATIQDGVDAVADGGIVNVAAGTYSEQVIINKSLTLNGTGGPVVEPPVDLVSSLAVYKIEESSRDFYPMLFAYGGTDDGSGNITGPATIEVTITGFDIDGNNSATASMFAGLLMRNCLASEVTYNDFFELLFSAGNPQTGGIVVYGNSNVLVDNNTVNDWTRVGIGILGDYDVLTDPTAVVSNNIVAGEGPLPYGSWAQNGIQLSGGSMGSISGNEVSDIAYIPIDWAASGLTIDVAGTGIAVSGNNVHDCEAGIYASYTDALTIDNSNTFNQNEFIIILGGDGITVEGNSFTNNDQALYLADAINVTVSENTFSSNNYCIIADGVASNLDFIGNTITGSASTAFYIDEYYGDEPTDVTIRHNSISGNAYGVYNLTSVLTDAEVNWWGDPSGPATGTTITGRLDATRPQAVAVNMEMGVKEESPMQSIVSHTAGKDKPVLSANGSGDAVSDMVDYSPWWGGNYMNDDHSSVWNWYVDNSNSSTIMEGIDLTLEGDTVFATPAIYQGTGNKDIDFGGKDIVLAASGDVDNTVIDCQLSGRALYFHNGETEAAAVMGFTLKNGIIAGNGGAIRCENASSPRIANCLIIGNIVSGFGGGIACDGSSNSTIVNCTISKNTANGQYNSGGGIYCFDSSPIIKNTIVYENYGPGQAQIYNQTSSDYEPVVTYCDIQAGWPGSANIDTDPLFRNADLNNPDFHLMAIACGDSYDSPCIDIGHPNIKDLVPGCANGLGTEMSDLGAYGGGYEQLGLSYFPGDANMAGGAWPPAATGPDVTYLVNYFRGQETSQACFLSSFWCSADANGDCDVIGSDVTYLVNYFRGESSPKYCPDSPPAWLTPDDLPTEAPSGWPNCETTIVNQK